MNTRANRHLTNLHLLCLIKLPTQLRGRMRERRLHRRALRLRAWLAGPAVQRCVRPAVVSVSASVCRLPIVDPGDDRCVGCAWSTNLLIVFVIVHHRRRKHTTQSIRSQRRRRRRHRRLVSTDRQTDELTATAMARLLLTICCRYSCGFFFFFLKCSSDTLYDEVL